MFFFATKVFFLKVVLSSNYGTQNIGLDWLFGTFAARESDVKGQDSQYISVIIFNYVKPIL